MTALVGGGGGLLQIKVEQRQEHLGASRVDMTRLSPAIVGREGGEEREGNQVQQPRGQKYERDTGNQSVWIPYI